MDFGAPSDPPNPAAISSVRLPAVRVGNSNPSSSSPELVISRSTVKFHVSSILSKLDADSRTEAVARAFQQEFLA